MKGPPAPAVVLLDTNVVVLSWRYRVGDERFDLVGELRRLAAAGQERLALDLLSLDELFALARWAARPRFIVAPKTFEELEQSCDSDAAQVIGWATEIAVYNGRLRAEALLTCDYRLIRRREKGRRLELQALTPFEVEDWMLGCRRPPWDHREACRARLSRIALLTRTPRGLRLGDVERNWSEPIRAAQ
jgi:hypothetical protein